MNLPRDPELDDLFWQDSELGGVAEQLRMVPHASASVEPAPAFRMELRRKLMREAWVLASQPPPPWCL